MYQVHAHEESGPQSSRLSTSTRTIRRFDQGIAADPRCDAEVVTAAELAERKRYERTEVAPNAMVENELERQRTIQRMLGVPVGDLVFPELGRLTETLRAKPRQRIYRGGGRPAKPVVEVGTKNRWDSVADCARAINLRARSVAKACADALHNPYRRCNGHRLMYESDYAEAA